MLPIFLLAAVLALIFWGWKQDWAEDTPAEQVEPRIEPPQRMPVEEPPPFSAAEPPAQRAQANLASYFTDDDYPVDAIRNEQQGAVAFVLAVSPEGRVTSCRIAQSSGSPALDGTTCRLLRSRARFQPARNEAGRAVPDEVRGRIKWILPSG
ncbi:energy transducer TonB [Sphingomonas glaciei]|uniref:Energy transducer TonB n=1 Tax=Sphingomonas glaciei TaxID=2938948 RepID=A0ABY5MVZ9_9SPHN|nr:energy transducer TonB [Sphingomonas glaciei]UUR08638.1 energy transducer TonB [Sphingomonas glaciei]